MELVDCVSKKKKLEIICFLIAPSRNTSGGLSLIIWYKEGCTRIGWDEEMNWAVCKLKGKALISTLLRICWSSCIYLVWKERNQRIFQRKSKMTEQVLEQVKEVVRCRLDGLHRVEAEHVNRSLCRNWGLLDTILV